MPTAGYLPPVRASQSGRGILQAQEAPATRYGRAREVEGVFVVHDGQARFRPVETGIQGEMDVEIVDGLAEDDEVITGPHPALRTLAEWDRVAVDNRRRTADELRPRTRRR